MNEAADNIAETIKIQEKILDNCTTLLSFDSYKESTFLNYITDDYTRKLYEKLYKSNLLENAIVCVIPADANKEDRLKGDFFMTDQIYLKRLQSHYTSFKNNKYITSTNYCSKLFTACNLNYLFFGYIFSAPKPIIFHLKNNIEFVFLCTRIVSFSNKSIENEIESLKNIHLDYPMNTPNKIASKLYTYLKNQNDSENSSENETKYIIYGTCYFISKKYNTEITPHVLNEFNIYFQSLIQSSQSIL